jgi:hypothetical protein
MFYFIETDDDTGINEVCFYKNFLFRLGHCFLHLTMKGIS